MTQPITESWDSWQREVVALLQEDFCEVFGEIGLNDVDWPAWHPLFVQGRSPRAAIERAFERDL